jgi:5'-3' exonuclease
MGIERFFKSVINNQTIQTKDGKFILKDKIQADFISIDFNSILYRVASEIEKELNYLIFDIIYKDNTEKKLENKSLEIAKIWDFKIGNLDDFKKYFNEEKIDQMSIQKVKEHLTTMFDDIIDGTKLRKIKISMDGIPNMGKMVEQKKRRYNLYLINKLKKELYKDHCEKLDGKTKIYENNKFGYNRNKILAWNSFMTRVTTELTDKEYINNLKKKYVHLEEFTFSGANIPGEGEKKIIEYILQNNSDGKYVIYSPDSDVIILSMILAIKMPKSKFFMMHYEQNKEEYTVIDINKLNQNIFDYVKSRIKLNIDLDCSNIINDIAMLLSMFGNDFIPKIESLDVRKDFIIIINKYCDVLNNSYGGNIFYLTSCYNSKVKINYQSLKNFFGKMSDVEIYLIKDTYMANNYSNYKRLKEQLEVNNLYIWLTSYIENVNKLLNEIYGLIGQVNEKLDNKSTTEICHNILEPFIKNLYNKYDKEFIKDFVIVEGKKKMKDIGNLLEKEFNDKIKSYFVISNNESSLFCKVDIKLRLRLIPFDDDIEAKYHKDNLDKLKIIEYMELTEYDKENYLIERMMGKFRKNLNAINNEVGKISLTVTKTSGTKKYYKIITSLFRKEDYDDQDYLNYYKLYFNCLPTNKIVNNYCEEYLSGLFWLTDFYFNKNDANYNYNNISTWFYKSHRPPLIREITNYMFQKKYNDYNEFVKNMNKLQNKSISEIVNREEFFNTREQYFYITPKNSLTNIPISVKKVIDDNPIFFPDLDKIVLQIYNFENKSDKIDNNNPIDCSTATFFNKCNLSIEPLLFQEFSKIMKSIRSTYKYTESVKDPFIITYKSKNEQKGGGLPTKIINKIKIIEHIIKNMTNDDLVGFRNKYKNEYKINKKPITKVIYKLAKRQLHNN